MAEDTALIKAKRASERGAALEWELKRLFGRGGLIAPELEAFLFIKRMW